MSGPSGEVLFIIGSGVQLDTALRVAGLLKRPARFLDIWTGELVSAGPRDLAGHLAPVTWQRLRAVGAAAASWAAEHPAGIVVTPQDVGLVYRRAIATARSKGVRIALLPDGAVSIGKVTQRKMLGGLVPLADSVLRGLGFAAGKHGQMGASQPDAALSWGPAWDAVFRHHGVQTIVDVGNPRSDDLAEVGPPQREHILVCSQPMDHAAIGGAPAAAKWYSFLERLADSAPPGRLRIRLHPAETGKLSELPLGPHSRELLTSGTTLAEDLGWAGSVVSWASTTMLEAAGAARAVVSLAVNPTAAELARGYYFQRDPRIVTALTDEVSNFTALWVLVDAAQDKQAGLADDYLVNVGSAAQAAADFLDNWEPATAK